MNPDDDFPEAETTTADFAKMWDAASPVATLPVMRLKQHGGLVLQTTQSVGFSAARSTLGLVTTRFHGPISAAI